MAFNIEIPTPFILMLRPRSGQQQWIESEEYRLHPSVQPFEFTDDYGNLCQRLIAPPGDFLVTTSARVMTVDTLDEAPGGCFVEVQNLPDAVLKYLLPSRFCESDRFANMAWEITRDAQPGYDQVLEIERWIHANFEYAPGSSFTSLSATEVNQQSTGVCRDFSHLGVALTRALSIPARMVVGYLHELDPMEMHAWFEAYVADRWYAFDATRPGRTGGYVAIGFGRDAADVAIYNQFGPAVFPLYQRVSVEQVAAIGP
jgi:transglutaminase-like putative cysteine protease